MACNGGMMAKMDAPKRAEAGGARSLLNDEILDQFGGNRELIAKFEELLRVGLGRELANLEQALAAGDGELIVRAAHTIKGLAANLRVAEPGDLARDLEQSRRAGHPEEDGHASFARLRLACLRVLESEEVES